MGGSRIGPLSDFQVGHLNADGCLTLAVDGARQMITDLGLRPYRVFLVWVGWTNDVDGDGLAQGLEATLQASEEGVGRAILLKEVELLPTPDVSGLDALGGEVEATGLTERGTLTVSKISPGYTEDQLQGLIPGFRDPVFSDTLRKGVSFFYEVQQNRPGNFSLAGTAAARQFCPDPLRSPRRRFHLSGTPSLDGPGFEWVIQLTRADGERGRNGEVREVEGGFGY